MYRTVGGLDIASAWPHHVHALVAPQPGGGLTWARSSLHTLAGRYTVAWQLEAGEMRLSVSIPANATAQVLLPHARQEEVTEQDLLPAQLSQQKNRVAVELGSGDYLFVYPYHAEDAS
jgi:alpha-L-rhamnosidase